MAAKKIRANKKADMLWTFVQIVFFVLLFFFAYKAFNNLMGFWVKDIEQGTIRSMEGLKIEIDNMVSDKVTVPIYIDENNKINGFVNSINPSFCTVNKSCICICSLDSECENNAMKKCLTLKSRLSKDFSCKPKTNEGKAQLYNIDIINEKDKIDVICK